MPRRALRRTRQAEEGEVEETELAVYEHGAEAADEVADELRDGIRTMVVCELDPETAWWDAQRALSRTCGAASQIGTDGSGIMHLWPRRATSSACTRQLRAVKGAPSKLLFPIGIHHLRRLLDLIGLTE